MDKKLTREEVYGLVISHIDFNDEITNDDLHHIIDSIIENNQYTRYMSLNERWSLHKDVFDSLRGFGVLQELLEDDEITEIMVNDIKKIFVEKRGKIEKFSGQFPSAERLEDIIQQIVGSANKRVNQADPIVDTRLPDGSRVNVVLSPIAIAGSTITIRKFPKKSITMEDLIDYGSITKEAAEMLKELVVGGYNIFISGGTGSGKTTFLNALSNYIPADERIITIEDSAELRLQNVDNIVRMEARQENFHGECGISIRDLIRTALRMRPDRIIVGEVRGTEALDMLQAMNTGHDGSMSTGHGNSAKDMMTRLETMVLMGVDMPLLAIRNQIASAIDIVVHLSRMRDKSRKVISIQEITGVKDGEITMASIYERENCEGGRLLRTSHNIFRKSLGDNTY